MDENSTLLDLDIRPAQRQDLPSILELVRLLEADGQVLDLPSAARIFDRFQLYPDYTLYVGELDGEIIGMFALLIMDNLAHLGAPSGILEDLVVKNSFQGQGVGRSMLAFAMQICRTAGCYKLVLSSSLQRNNAHRFYRNLGFKQYGLCFEVQFLQRTFAAGEFDE